MNNIRGLAKLVIILGTDLSGISTDKRPEDTQLEVWLGGGSIFPRYDKNSRHECKKNRTPAIVSCIRKSFSLFSQFLIYITSKMLVYMYYSS